MTKTKVYVGMSLAWIVGMGFYLPLGVATSGVQDGFCNQWSIFPDDTTRNIVSTIDFIITFPVAVVWMLIAYIHMIIALRRQAKVSSQQTKASVAEVERKTRMHKICINIFLTMATVSIVFFLCGVWNVMWGLVNKLAGPLRRDTAFYHFSVYAVMINCVVNPFIYLSRYNQFKNAFLVIVLKKPNVKNIYTQSSHTGTTKTTN